MVNRNMKRCSTSQIIRETQKHNEIAPHTCKDGYNKTKIKPEKISVGENVEKLEFLCTVGGNVKWSSYNGKQYGGSLKN